MKDIKFFLIKEASQDNVINKAADLLSEILPMPESEHVTSKKENEYEKMDDDVAKIFAQLFYVIQEDHHFMASDKFFNGFKKYYEEMIDNN